MKFTTDEIVTLMTNFLSELGGKHHLTLTSKEWHVKYPEAANTLFGFNSFDEMELYIGAFFRDVPIEKPTFTFDVTPA